MATRRSIGMGALSGVGEGLETAGAAWLRNNMAEQANTRISERELFKDYTDKVMKGDLEPEQAEAALASRGYKVPGGYFQSLQPSVESGLQKIIGGMGKADTFQGVEGVTALGSEPAVKRLPMKLGKFDSPSEAFTDNAPTPERPQPEGFTQEPAPTDTLGSVKMQPFSPEFDRLLKIREEKLNSFAPKEVNDVNAEGVKRTQFVPSRPDQLTGRGFQTEPNPEQAGRNKATTAITEQRTSNIGGLPQLKGEAFVGQENVERPAKVQTATDMARGTAQAGIDVSTSPANVKLEARKQAILTDATTRARMLAEQLPPEIAGNVAQNLIQTTATGRPFAFIDPSAPKDIRDAAYKVLTAPSEANPKGIKIVNKAQADALQALDKARADYDALMNRLENHLAKNAEGRPLSALNNQIGVYLQTDPELVAALATSFPQIIQNLKANAGTVGRIMQIELEGMAKSIPQASDTWRVAQLKQMAEFEMFQHAENAILGHPAAK